MKTTDKMIASFLLAHGLDEKSICSKTPEELKAIYAQGLKTYIKQFLQETPKKEQISQNPFLQLKNPQELFDLNLKFFEHFSLEEITLMLNKQFGFIKIERIEEITKILFSAFQETILQEIEEKLQKLPQEESQLIMQTYEQQRNNIKHLIHINKKLESETFREKLQLIINIKALIQKEELERSAK